MFILGVNQNEYTGKEIILSNGSFIIGCLVPLAKVVHEKFSIDQATVVFKTSFKFERENFDERLNQVFHQIRKTKILFIFIF